ncbi:MAG: hypothetical protein QM611_05025 [Microbacterium sp.]|uniref:hypothetical protein n=1 Tax=Microbacterium sp. TaxID=51671 RepID=UPI0039E41783
MAAKAHKIHSLPADAPWEGGLPPAGSPEHPATIRALDRVMAIQRPVVVAHLRSIRLRHPDATPTEIVRMLERRYLAAVTTGGAAVGATAVVPGVTTGITLALSGAETVGFLESTALFAQSIAEVHGIPVDNPDRARALVLTLMLGKEGTDLLAQLAGQAAGRSAGRPAYWGELITKTLPRAAVGPLVDRLKSAFIRQFAAKAGASWVGKALPFGIGAVIGGTGNHILARRVVTTARHAFGIAPTRLPEELEPKPGARPMEELAASKLRRAGGAIAETAGRAGSAVTGAGKRAADAGKRALTRGRTPDKAPSSEDVREIAGSDCEQPQVP